MKLLFVQMWDDRWFGLERRPCVARSEGGGRSIGVKDPRRVALCGLWNGPGALSSNHAGDLRVPAMPGETSNADLLSRDKLGLGQ